MRCGHATQSTTHPAPSPSGSGTTELPSDGGVWSHPYFGFNAKGSVNVEQQTEFANEFFDQVKDPEIKKNLVVRVTGGTISQRTNSKDWSDAMINSWVDLQKKQGIRFIYVVNGNDTPAGQSTEIQRWFDAGAHFDMLEMMNEYYLPKFQKGDISKPEVTVQVTAESYVNDILPRFWKELDKFSLPYYLIFSPTRPGHENVNNAMLHWNDVVADAINNKYPDKQLNATLHLYLRSENDLAGFDYDQIERVRKQLPKGRHIAITEAGVIDPSLDSQASGQITIQHDKNILPHLRAGDYLLDQVLYTPAKKDNSTALSPSSQGATPKGEAILQFINNKLN